MMRKAITVALAVLFVQGALGAQTATPAIPKDVSQELLVAKITLPWNNSLVRANVPVFGFAGGKEFRAYRLEYGEGRAPKVWIPISSGTTPHNHDPWSAGEVKWNPNTGARGTLGDWRTGLTSYHYGEWDKTLLGEYTLRLVVEGKDGSTVEDRIHLTVADVLVKSRDSELQSPDGVFRLKAQQGTVTSNFVLVSMLPSTEPKLDPELKLIGSAYEFRPPGVRFLKPAKLVASFKMKDLDTDGDGKPDLSPQRLGIYHYRPVEEDWRRLPNQWVSPAKTSGTVTAEMWGSTQYLAYIALMADLTPPKPPELDPVGPELAAYSVVFSGKSEAQSAVEILLDDKSFARCDVDETGRFSTDRMRIAPGRHVLAARAVDAAGNVSASTEPVKLSVEPSPPRKVNSIRFLGDVEAHDGDRFLIELTGEDASDRVDHVLVKVTSSSDPKGLEVELTETGPRTGIYVGLVTVEATTSPARPAIQATRNGETIAAVCSIDGLRKAELRYTDKVPPSTPRIGRFRYPVLVMKGFDEADEKEALVGCETVEGEYGAGLSLAEDDGGNRFLKLTRQQWQSHLGAVIMNQPFQTAEWPLLSFDCMLPSGLKVDLLVRLADQKTYTVTLTGDKPYYPSLGNAEGVKDDGQWHTALIPLHRMLKQRFPEGDSFQVERIEFGSWTQKAYMRQDYGADGPAGMWFGVDNYTVFRSSAPRTARFSWRSEDANGIAGYSHVFDRSPRSSPPDRAEPVSSATFEPTEPGLHFLHVRALDKCGNWSRTSHCAVLWDDQPPEVGKMEVKEVPGRQVLTVSLRDLGVGVDPGSLTVLLGDRCFTWGGKTLSYDRDAGLLTIDPWLDEPGYVPVDGERVSVTLAAADLAGQGFQNKSLGDYRAKSPLQVFPTRPDGEDGFYVTRPKVSYQSVVGEKAFYQWQIDFSEDELGRKGQSLNTLMLTLTYPDGQTLSLAKDFKLDTTTPATRVFTEEKGFEQPFDGQDFPRGARILLRHEDFALVPGGLEGSYYSSPELSGLVLQTRTDNLDYYSERLPAGKKVHSAVWEGCLRAPSAGEYRLRIHDLDAFGQKEVYVDGELIMETRPDEAREDLDETVFLTKSWHRLRIVFVPRRAMTRPLALLWNPPRKQTYEVIPTENLASLRSLASTHYRWDDGEWELYTTPLTPPRGAHKLTFYSEDQAGHKETPATIQVNVR